MSKQKETELLNVFANAKKNSIINKFDTNCFLDYFTELLTHANAITIDFFNKNRTTLYDNFSLSLEKKKSNETAVKLYKKTQELNKEIMEILLACLKQKMKNFDCT